MEILSKREHFPQFCRNQDRFDSRAPFFWMISNFQNARRLDRNDQNQTKRQPESVTVRLASPGQSVVSPKREPRQNRACPLFAPGTHPHTLTPCVPWESTAPVHIHPPSFEHSHPPTAHTSLAHCSSILRPATASPFTSSFSRKI
jgi:hypothetical protein